MSWKPLGSPWASTPAPWGAPAPKRRGRPPKPREGENPNIALAEPEAKDQAPALPKELRALRESLTEQIAAARDPEAQLKAALEMIDMQRRVIESLTGETL